MEFITLELRPRLQSCNAFIAVRKDLCLKNVRIKLMESNIILVLEDCRINLSLPSVKIVPTSLSTLNVINNWICFRLQTAPLKSVFGSFSTEIITHTNTSVQSSNSLQSFLDNIKLLFKTSECIILCTCCKNVLSKSINFKRFLSLPDLEYDPNEWFCCKHSSNVITNVQLQESDYLYGSCFSVLHKNIFENNVHIDNKALICNKCLLHIGTPHAYSLFKIWNCCVDYKPQSSALNTINATDPLNDFLLLIKDSLSEILGEEIILQTSVGKQIHCLLIKPMDCKLNLITEPNHKVMNDIDTIFLQQKCVTKVLYKYGTNKITNTNYSNIKHIEVGLSIIEAGLNYLLLSTKRLPHVYRTITDCFLGYIVL
ncbi:E3 ubiquitin-protein ligase E3D [Camponotus japonicus]